MGIAVLDGNKIREELRRLRKTQRDLARFGHLQDEEVSRAVTGKPVSPETVYRVALTLQHLERGVK